MKKENQKLMLKAGYASIGLTAAIIILKIFAFILTNSVAVLATLFDSVQDLMTSSINLFAIKQSLIPADKDHRFGHGKAQAIGGLVQAIIIFLSAIILMTQSCQHWHNHQVPDVFSFGTILLCLTIVPTILLVRFQKKVILKTNSLSIRADSTHYTGDIWMNSGVILSLIFSALFQIEWLDILFGIGVGLYLCKTTWEIAKSSIEVLMDKEMPQPIQEQIKQIVLSINSVQGIEELKTRQSGSCLFIQMKVLMNSHLTLKQAHYQSDIIEHKLKSVFHDSEIILHLEPDSK